MLYEVITTISGILVIFGFIAFIEIVRGDANMGVDFSGGSLLQYQADKNFTMSEVRRASYNFV